MKRIFVTFIAAAALFAGCTKDDTGMDAPAAGNRLNLKASVAETRATATAFEQGDQVGLFLTNLNGNAAAYTNEKLTVGAAGALKGAGELTYPVKTKSVSIAAYYPYAEGVASASAVPVNLPQDQSELDESSVDLMGAYIADMEPTSDVVNLEFSHMLSKVKIELVAGANATDVEVADAEAVLMASLAGNVDVTTGAVSGAEAAKEVSGSSLIVLPQTVTGTMAKVKSSYGTFDVAAPAEGLVLEAGKINTVTIKVNVKEQTGFYVATRILDWEDSTVDSIGISQPIYPEVIDLSANGTANCYVVNKPGQLYSFDATVKGNGKQTEGVESVTINPTKAFIYWTIVPVYPDPTVNENSTATRGLGCDETMNKTVLRKSVKLEDGKVIFRTNLNMSDGNVSIAVADDDNNILWSWHIWAVNDFDLDAAGIEIDHPAVKGITMLDRNLGAYSNGSLQTWGDESNAIGLHYQWGRKDPFPVNRTVSGWHYYYYWYDAKADMDMYKQGLALNTIPKCAAADFSGWEEAVAYSIANPIFHIAAYDAVTVGGTAPDGVTYTIGKATSPYTWFKNGATVPSDGWGGLWGNAEGEDELGSGSKTIYDPCPAGWRVPEPEAFRFMTVDGVDVPSADSAKKCIWKLNCSETVAENAVVDAMVSQGFHFYVKGAKSLSEDGEVVLPQDQTTIYFPGAGIAIYSSYPDNDSFYDYSKPTTCFCEMYTNAPVARFKADGGLSSVGAIRASMRTDGRFTSRTTGGRYEQLASACPIRCIKEQ